MSQINRPIESRDYNSDASGGEIEGTGEGEIYSFEGQQRRAEAGRAGVDPRDFDSESDSPGTELGKRKSADRVKKAAEKTKAGGEKYGPEHEEKEKKRRAEEAEKFNEMKVTGKFDELPEAEAKKIKEMAAKKIKEMAAKAGQRGPLLGGGIKKSEDAATDPSSLD